MSTFTLDVSSPLPSGYTGPLGGPGEGDHAGKWYMAAGNDLGAAAGTPVFAAFTGKVSVVDPTGVGATSGKVYGVGLFVRASAGGLDPTARDGVGGFYTHFDLEPGIAAGSEITRGQQIGRVVAVAGIPSHVHFAIAVRTNEVYTGANIYEQLKAMSNTSDVRSLTLSDGARGGSLGGFEEEPEPLVIPEN
jgi:murein DD-endopeptidase MepM/ murein hydrolase activator NlpD